MIKIIIINNNNIKSFVDMQLNFIVSQASGLLVNILVRSNGKLD